jgi:putative flavoprotein involved in K+ transport
VRKHQADHIDTVIVGGGQAGLAMSYHLRQRGREHVILERRRVAERWRTLGFVAIPVAEPVA